VHADRQGRLVVTHGPPQRGRSYPTLEEALDLCRGRIGVMIELKRPWRYRRFDVVRRTVELVSVDDALVCFEHAALVEARALRKGLRTVQHVGLGVSIRRAAGAWAAGFRNDRVTPRGLEAARRIGLATTVYTVNDERRLLELDALGVDGVFTDLPRRARQILARRPPG